MKSISYSLIAAAAAVGMAYGQNTATTKPVGYETATLASGFNFIGLRLHDSAVLNGTFESSTTDTLVDNEGTFQTALTAGKLYLVEINAGAKQGVIVEVMGGGASQTTLSGLANITADYRTSYSIRPAKTLSSVFGSGATCVLKKGTSATADSVYVPNSSGGFDTYFHSADTTPFPGAPTTPGKWQKIGTTADQGATPVNYLDGFYVEIRGSQVSLTVSGEVKTTPTSLPAIQGFSYYSSVYPAGSTLESSGLASVVTKGTAATADLVFMPVAGGGFGTFYHSADTVPFPGAPTVPGKWEKVGGSGNQGAVEITSGMIFQRRGASADLKYTPPASYTGL